MKKFTLFILGAFGFMLGACSTGQVTKSMYACGGTSHLTAEFSAYAEGGRPQLKSVNVCSGTNGRDRTFEYVLYDGKGRELKRISYGSGYTEATSALIVVGEVLKATASSDRAVSEAAIKALPAALKLLTPIP